MSSIHDYSDIVHLPHPDPKNHLRMPISDRAAQFAPFAALTGFSGVIEEAGRVTEEKVLLDDGEKERIERILQRIHADIKNSPKVSITYFQPDAKKSGGKYVTISACAAKIDPYARQLILDTGEKIKFDDILNITRD